MERWIILCGKPRHRRTSGNERNMDERGMRGEDIHSSEEVGQQHRNSCTQTLAAATPKEFSDTIQQVRSPHRRPASPAPTPAQLESQLPASSNFAPIARELPPPPRRAFLFARRAMGRPAPADALTACSCGARELPRGQ